MRLPTHVQPPFFHFNQQSDMRKEIFLKPTHQNNPTLKVIYTMSKEGKYHHIECVVDPSYHKPDWLEMFKFNFISIKKDNHYSLLFDDLKYNKNLPTIHFIDHVYASIMQSNSLSYDH